MAKDRRDGREVLGKAEVVSASDAVEVLPVKELPPLASQARDLEALRTAVVDAAGDGTQAWRSATGPWCSISLSLVSAGGVTHEDPFLEIR